MGHSMGAQLALEFYRLLMHTKGPRVSPPNRIEMLDPFCSPQVWQPFYRVPP